MAASKGSSRFLRHLLRQVGKTVANNQKEKVRSQQLIKYYKKAIKTNQDKEVEDFKVDIKDKINTWVNNEKVWAEVHRQYYSNKEISVEETAKKVGAKIPIDPYSHEPNYKSFSDKISDSIDEDWRIGEDEGNNEI